MANLYTRLITMMHGRKVGADAMGNVYYETRRQPKTGRRKRWVMYLGAAEPTKVPPEWHGWLHYTYDVPLTERPRYDWEKPHHPNLSGTPYAYLPKGAIQRGGTRAPSSSDYEPWSPDNAA